MRLCKILWLCRKKAFGPCCCHKGIDSRTRTAIGGRQFYNEAGIRSNYEVTGLTAAFLNTVNFTVPINCTYLQL